MAAPAIRVENLGKQYRIGERQDRYDTLRDSLTRGLKSLVTRDRTGIFSREWIWAIRDVSFDVQPGEVVGIIGRNGAGKTTLLRILSRITEPTEGQAAIRGRLGSLLEVGTGFHPELTGRDNVFLNGAILGMSRREIARKFDEIVDFSGVEAHIDTPVKRYSTGMQVRLAFAVAAHLEPEILLIDEVLAVGDAEFQKKCIGKMRGIGESGRTILFVSHSMPTIARLCERAVLLEHGSVVEDGPADRVIARYLHSGQGSAPERTWSADEAPGEDYVRLRSVRVLDERRVIADVVDVRRPVGIEMSFEVIGDGPAFVPWLVLHNDQGMHVFSATDIDPFWSDPPPSGHYRSTAWIPGNLLNEGTVTASVSLNTFRSGGKAVIHARADEVVSFLVVDAGEGDTARGHYAGTWTAPVRPLLEWDRELADQGIRSGAVAE